MPTTLELFFSNLITGLPQIAIGAVGLLLVHTRLRRSHPKAYLYGTIGMTLLLANGLLGVLSRTYIQSAIAQAQHPISLANKTSMVSAAGYLISVISLVFILMALVADRGSEQNSRVAA